MVPFVSLRLFAAASVLLLTQVAAAGSMVSRMPSAPSIGAPLATPQAAPPRAALRTVTVTIQGMSCGGCAKSIQKALSNIAGVEDAKVSYDKHQAVIRYNTAHLSQADLLRAIEKLGYRTSVVKES